MKQVYLDQNVSVQDVICLDVKQAHHIFDVLRTTSKEKIRIVPGTINCCAVSKLYSTKSDLSRIF